MVQLKQFYYKLDTKLNFTEGPIVIALSTEDQLRDMMKAKNLPMIDMY